MDIRLDDIRAQIESIENETLRASILTGFNNLADMQATASKQSDDSLSRLKEAQDTNRALLARVTTSQMLPGPDDTVDLETIQQSFIYRPAPFSTNQDS